MKLIVGLGNPGKKYERSRHNFGFMSLDNYLSRNNIKMSTKNRYEYTKENIYGEQVIFLKPLTFMNLSGEAVQEVMNFYKLHPDDIMIIYDDLDMEYGRIKIKKNSSSGGHNGIKNITNHLKTQKYIKVKLGINNESKKEVKNFVLSNFSKEEEKKLEKIFSKTDEIIDDFITGKNELELMNKYN